jgi:hypothetical protein
MISAGGRAKTRAPRNERITRVKELREETSTAKMTWDSENEIVWTEVFADMTSVEQAMEGMDAQERLRDRLNKEMTRVVVDFRGLTEMSKEVRDYFGNERTAAIQRASALLVGSPVSRVIGNFFMGLNKPLTPTRMFTDPREAIRWLHTFSND